MDLDPRHFFTLLHQYLENENTGPRQCNQLIINLNDVLTREQVNLPDLDLYLQCLFNKSQGLLDFVTKIVNKKQFKSSVISVFEIIYTLINNFSSKLEKYITVIYDICFKVIKSSLVTSDEKVKALEVVTLSFEKINKCLDYPECYNDVYNSLLKTISIKKGDTVQEKIFKALGAFAKHFQYLISNHESLKSIFVSALEAQMVQKDFSNGVVCGVFTGLDYFCESFPLDPKSKEDEIIINRLCKYLDRMTVPTSRIKIANRAALTFLGNNMSIFVNLMIENIQHWHETLLKWLDYGADDQKVGVFVIKAFYSGVGIFLLNDLCQQHTDVIRYFIQCFKKTFKDNKATHREKHLCLHGFSALSPVYQTQLSEEELKDTLILIVQNFEQSFILDPDPSRDVLEDLPFYLQTVAKFVHFRKITNSELFYLQKGTILMIKVYPQLPYSCHAAVIEALVSTCYYLLSNDQKMFDNFMESVIYQGVVWSCSHQHVSEADILEKGTPGLLTVKNYFSMWRKLLRILPVREFDKMGIFLHDRKYILTKIIDKLMKTLLVLVNKLNVSILVNDAAEAATDIQSAYKVAVVNDFAIFLNMVDFYEEIFEEVDPSILKKCACKLIQHLVGKCDKFPLISGFYKLLSFSLKVCNKINYFDESSSSVAQDVKMCNLTLTIFADTVLNKTQEYKGDLLIACLQVLLQYPIVIIRKILPACVPSFKTIFYVGRNYVQLAHMALDTLEQWQKEVTCDEMEPFLIQVIPLLDYYLQSKSLGGFTESSVPENRRKTAQALKKRKVLLYVEPELIRLQMRIIKFIGGQSSALCEAFAFREDDTNLSVWSNQQHLKIVLPYNDIKLDIYLDKLLPRITNIALNSSDRKTRVMACELLQAIVMIFLGATKQMTQSGLSDLNELLRHISVPLLKLGCDMDQVVEQLFRPLCFQLIHWYTHVSQSRSEHSAIIIESVLESITHPTDTALRDFSGKCINEFVKWTIKQTSEKNLARDPINIKILIKKMRFYSTHPDPYKKLGAALIFNNIYRELREETALLSMFWIEFLHIFIKSLSTYEYEATDENSIVQINSALSHIERGFVEKSSMFNKEDRDRRIPVDMKGGTLKHVALWLLEQSGSSSRYCRAKCMDLFCSFAPRTTQFSTLESFVVKSFKKKNWVVEIYEAFLTRYPTLEKLSECEGLGPNKWMQAFLCALDGYKFVVTNKLTPLNNILSATIISAIHYFLNKLSKATLEQAYSFIETKEWLFTSFEKRTFDKQRSQAAVKILELLNALSPNFVVFCTPDLWNFVVDVIFNRESLGFECFLPNSSIDAYIAPILKTFLTNLPVDKAGELLQILQRYVNEQLVTDIDFNKNVSHKQRNLLKALNMLQSFSLTQFSVENFSNNMVATLLNKFISEAESGIIYVDNLQDTTLIYCLSIFDFALPNENEFKSFVDFLYKPYQVQTADFKQPIHLGTYLLTAFEESVIEKIINNFDTFLDLSLKNYSAISQTTELLFYIFSYTVPKKQLKYLNQTVILLTNWAIFETHFNESSNAESGLDFVKCLLPIIKSCKLACVPLKNWLVSLLHGEQNSWKHELDFKAEVFYLLVDVMDETDDDNTNLREGLMKVRTRLLSDMSPIPPEAKTIFLDKLLCTVPKIQTPELLIFLLDLFVKITTEKSSSDMKRLLIDYIIKTQPTQKTSLSKLYNLYLNHDLDNTQRYKLVSNTMSVFQYCNLSVFEDFFVDHIVEIISTLKQPITPENLVTKISYYLLIETLFLRCPVRSTDTEVHRITQAALPQKPSNKTLLLQLLKITLDAVKDSCDCDSNSEEFFRLYKCHSYNAMVSIVSNSMKEVNFYTKLFVRQENNDDILWNSLIDTKKNYVFQTDFDTIPNKRKILVNIRDEVRAQKKKQIGQSQSIKYIESMRVYNSSLSEDFTKFDFSNNLVRTELEQEESSDEIPVQSEIELDCTDVNSHECMATVCGLIEYMVNINIIDLPSEEDDDYELPAWVNGIRTLLLNPETHSNIKIFWIKVIDNTIHIFKHFAKWFLEPLLKFIVDKCAGNSLNYFITDVVAILAAWSTNVVPQTEQEVQLASDLITFLINNLNNERQDMFKYHLDLIRLLIEAWRSSITVTYDLLHSKLNVDPTSKKAEVGIHLFSIFLANKIFPWEDKATEFCKTVFNIILKNNHKSTYKPCCESIGLLLRLKSKDSSFSKVFNNVHVLLKKITDPDKYAHVLEAIVLHYPEVADEFHIKLLLSRVHGVLKPLKVIYLKIILNRSSLMGKIDEFKTENWDSYIKNDNLEVQLVSLEIVHKCLDVLKQSPHFKSIVEAVCTHVSNSNVLCRTRMFDIVTLIWQKGSYSPEILNLCKPVLVQGLIDSDNEIREKVFDFWRNHHELPSPIAPRFTYVLSNLYEVTTENDFLGYSSHLLLDIIKQSDEYNELLFEHPLEDCDFENYELQTNWRMRHLSVVPLFAETVRSASLDFESMDSDMSKLRQTQTAREFAPTQSVRAKQFSQFTMSESSLFVKRDEESEFVNPNLVPLSHKYRVPKRRFLRDKSKIHSHFAQQEVKKLVQKTEQRKDLVKEREHKVVIYRSYRKGDLPDVQITLQAVLEPLQALTLHDGEISKVLYSQLFQNILHKMRSDQAFLERVSVAIKAIFNDSTQYNRNLFRTLFDALLQCKSSIVFPADLIVSVCQSSGLRALGVLLLEEYLISYDSSSSDPKKTRGTETTNEISLWIKLAELYKDMDDWDVVKSIFLEKTDCPESVKTALIAESRKQWKNAQDEYGKLIQIDENLERKDFYYESYFRCFAHLGEWDKVVQQIDSIVGNNCWDSLWDQGFNQQKLMPWYISGQLKNSLFTEQPSNQFLSNLNESLNSDRLDHLENRFCEEIAMLWIFQKESDEAEKYLKMYLNKFLDNWQQLDLFYSNLRYSHLLKLRNIIDINDFLTVFNNLNVENAERVQDLINHWTRTANENLPSILYCEEKVLYRKQFLNSLVDKIKSYNAEELEDIVSDLKQLRFNLDEGLMDIGIEQNNFFMTKKYLYSYNKQNILKLKVVLSKMAYLKSMMSDDATSKLEVLLKGCETLGQIFQVPGQSPLKALAYFHLFKQLNEISSIFRNDNDFFQLFVNEDEYSQQKRRLTSLVGTNNISSIEDSALFGAKKLKEFLPSYENEIDNTMETDTNQSNREYDTLANAYVQLAYFAKKHGESYFSDFMLFVLRAMKFNSSEGRQLFPCIIMEKEFKEEDKKQFIEETSKIPVWMFLGWIPQILVSVDSPKISAVAPLVLKIAKTYPQAIMYAYRLSKENYKSESEEFNELIEKLDNILLSDSRIDEFLKALSFIGVPASILMYFNRKIVKSIQTNDLDQAKNILKYLSDDLFNCKPDSRDVSLMQGNMFKKITKFDKDFKNFERLLNKSSTKSADLIKPLKKIDDELGVILRDEREAKKNSKLLKDYCPWLSNFSAHKMDVDLEIPGQYDGNKLPLTQHHIKISGFNPNVSVMPSIRKPIKITILGNDTKEYPFLIKFGEDIRQDQRIQQLFSLMNNIFDNDKSLSGKKFSILTYQVIPLTTSLGIIQWIDNTSSLQDFVKKSFTDSKSIKNYEQLFETYHKWVHKSSNQALDAYGRAAMNYSRDKVIPKFRSLASSIEWDAFRTQFLKLSTNIESFFALRNNFITSYAVMSVSQWILGVGDRHLSNTLICLQNGKVLGIDFGHAFGTGTQILPIPELVPFRLTPHIVSLMEPLGEKGLFREVMIHCLRAFRSNSSSLLATMNVFIEEPSLDWLEHASKFGGNTDRTKCEWYPAQKIDQAERKLRGAKSTTIMVEDLRAGHQKNQQYMKAYIKLVEGVAEFDLRARKEGDSLSVEDQVDCLIDHAADYNLLGRMYEGWAAWV
ncbi:hypothetical protein Zmor_000841 [Zophobas morio]|uniref:non-specific serine/threonine protein kinase n=1 Tax=Zophobas morio TaxID=2755281 RepID=A0AA38J0V3_9CUCU|nr:hypothetical protein Zmor_000841 [Zophobas morio]